MTEGGENNTVDSTNKNNKLKWIAIIILLLFGLGLYYYFYHITPGNGKIVISPRLEKKVNILIIGLDDQHSVKKGAIEADSIFIASLDTANNSISFTAIPPSYKIEDKLLKKMDVENIKKSVNKIMDNKIDYYFVMSYDGFKKVIDELSGVSIKLDESVEVPELGLYLKKGDNLLSGKEALNYVRWYNYDKEGKDRITRQEKVIDGIANKVTQTNILLNIPKLYKTIIETFKSVETNMDVDLVTDILKFMKNKNNIEIKYKTIKTNNN